MWRESGAKDAESTFENHSYLKGIGEHAAGVHGLIPMGSHFLEVYLY